MKVIISFIPSAYIIVCNKVILAAFKLLKRREKGETVCLEVNSTCPHTLWTYVYAPVVWLTPVIDVAGSIGPIFRVKLPLKWCQVITHTHWPSGETILPARVSLRQPDAGEHMPPAEREPGRDSLASSFTTHPSLSSQVTVNGETQRNTPTPSSFPLAPVLLTKGFQALRVNPTGQCCPTESETSWPGKHCPLVGLVLTGLQPVF